MHAIALLGTHWGWGDFDEGPLLSIEHAKPRVLRCCNHLSWARLVFSIDPSLTNQRQRVNIPLQRLLSNFLLTLRDWGRCFRR